MLQFPAWKIALVGLVCLLGVVYAAPNLIDRDAIGEVPTGVPGRQINLGLDLQGGSYLLLQVDTSVVVQERLEAIVETARRELRDAGIGYVGLGVQSGAAAFNVREAADLERARQLARGFEEGAEVSADGVRITVRLTDEAVAELTRNAVQQSIEIVRRRIDEAAQHAPLERLGLTTQCGFASSVKGNPLNEPDEEAKLARIVEVADAVWGNG